MRGEENQRTEPGHCPGITPAHAGRSPLGYVHFALDQDHPRACGEKGSRVERSRRRKGSPPRMRGEVGRYPYCWAAVRITPAHAGRSQQQHRCRLLRWDHPRACGEKSNPDDFVQSWRGSPPRMRGEVSMYSFMDIPTGITPAHAGRRLSAIITPPFYGDHPRACGEKATSTAKAGRIIGSPPRMRGEVPVHNHLPLPAGITPAHAGRRAAQAYCWHIAGDHPRACGEKARFLLVRSWPLGSPPRMRGEGY